MNIITDLADVLLIIQKEIGNLSIASDGEVRRRIAIAVLDGHNLLAKLEADRGIPQEGNHREEENRTNS